MPEGHLHLPKLKAQDELFWRGWRGRLGSPSGREPFAFRRMESPGGLLARGGGKEIQVVRENGKFGVCLCHAENPAGDKDGRVRRERWEVLPPLAVFEIHGNGKGLWGPRGRVVGGDTHAVVKERVPVV